MKTQKVPLEKSGGFSFHADKVYADDEKGNWLLIISVAAATVGYLRLWDSFIHARLFMIGLSVVLAGITTGGFVVAKTQASDERFFRIAGPLLLYVWAALLSRLEIQFVQNGLEIFSLGSMPLGILAIVSVSLFALASLCSIKVLLNPAIKPTKMEWFAYVLAIVSNIETVYWIGSRYDKIDSAITWDEGTYALGILGYIAIDTFSRYYSNQRKAHLAPNPSTEN